MAEFAASFVFENSLRLFAIARVCITEKTRVLNPKPFVAAKRYLLPLQRLH